MFKDPREVGWHCSKTRTTLAGFFPTGQWLTTRPDGEVWIADFKADGLWTDRADRSAAVVLAQPGNVASV